MMVRGRSRDWERDAFQVINDVEEGVITESVPSKYAREWTRFDFVNRSIGTFLFKPEFLLIYLLLLAMFSLRYFEVVRFVSFDGFDRDPSWTDLWAFGCLLAACLFIVYMVNRTRSRQQRMTDGYFRSFPVGREALCDGLEELFGNDGIPTERHHLRQTPSHQGKRGEVFEVVLDDVTTNIVLWDHKSADQTMVHVGTRDRTQEQADRLLSLVDQGAQRCQGKE